MKKIINDLTDITYPAEYETVRIPQQKCFPPRSFQGYQPLAYIRDILTLQRRVVKWLTGSDDPYAITSLISSYGFLPLNISGLADSKYFGVETQYNTKLINNKVINYNFFGKNVKVTQSTERTDKVNIEIRQLKCASNLGTNDGYTDGNMYLTTETSANAVTGILPDLYSLADPDINFGDWNDRELINIQKYNDNRFEIETKDYINFSTSGTFFVIAIVTPDSKTTNVVQSEIITPGMMNPSLENISGISNVILAGQNQNILFSINDWQLDDGDTYKAKIKLSFNINNIFKDENYEHNVKPTRFKIIVTHHNYDVASFGTFLNWDKWLAQEQQINKYIRKNMFTWTSKDYLYITGKDTSFQNFEYTFENDLHFKASEIDQIYQGNITFTLTNIKNLYNYASVYNNIQISANIADNNIITAYFYPQENIAQANKEINVKLTLPLKQNILNNILSTNVIIQNAYNKIEFSQIINLYDQLSSIINTLSSNNITNNKEEYFNDNDKLNNQHFGEKYRISDHTIDITKNDLQVIPYYGLYYYNTNNIQQYIRLFTDITSSYKSVLEFKNLHINNVITFIDNLFISKISELQTAQFEKLSNYIDELYFKDNNLYLLLTPLNIESFLLKIIINNEISSISQLICSSIRISNTYSPNNEAALNKLILQVSHLKNK